MDVATLSRILTDPEEARLRKNLSELAGLLDPTEGGALLRGMLAGGEAASRVVGQVDALDHVGLISLSSRDSAAAAAEAAGFDRRIKTFESTILTRRLARLAGAPVPVTMLKAWTGSPSGEIAVEVGMPQGVEAETVRGWIRDGIGAHLAFRVAPGRPLEEMEELLRPEGYQPPEGLGAGPFSNPAEGIATSFFVRRPAQALGLEFCRYGLTAAS